MTRLLGTRRSENAVKNRVLRLTYGVCVHGRRRRGCWECGVQETVARHASTPRTVLQQAPRLPTEGMMDGEGWDALAGELFTEVDWESKLHAW